MATDLYGHHGWQARKPARKRGCGILTGFSLAISYINKSFMTLALGRLLFCGCVPNNWAEQEVRVYLTVKGLQNSSKLSEGIA